MNSHSEDYEIPQPSEFKRCPPSSLHSHPPCSVAVGIFHSFLVCDGLISSNFTYFDSVVKKHLLPLLFLLLTTLNTRAEYSIWILEMSITANNSTFKGYCQVLPGDIGKHEDSLFSHHFLMRHIKGLNGGAHSKKSDLLYFYKSKVDIQIDGQTLTRLLNFDNIAVSTITNISAKVYQHNSFFSTIIISPITEKDTSWLTSAYTLQDTISCGQCFYRLYSFSREKEVMEALAKLKSDLLAIRDHGGCLTEKPYNRARKLKGVKALVLCIPDPEK